MPGNIVTAGGRWLALSASTQGMAERPSHALGRPEAVVDACYRASADRLEPVKELDAIVRACVGQRTLDAKPTSFLVADPHVQARGMLAETEDADLDSVPAHAARHRLSDAPGALRQPDPDLGQHEGEALACLRAKSGQGAP